MPNLTAEKLATIHSVTPATVRRWATKERHHEPCPHTKDGRGRLRFNASEVEQWLDRTGVLKRSQAQRPAPAPGPPVAIFKILKWTPQNIVAPNIEPEDLAVVAFHRTLETCLFVCRHREDLPTPGDFDLDDADDRDAAIDWLRALPHHPAEVWRWHAHQAITAADEFVEAPCGS